MPAPKSNQQMMLMLSDIREQQCGKERSGFSKIITVLSTSCVIYLAGNDRQVCVRAEICDFETSLDLSRDIE